jgi:hypothetical protein
MPIQIISLKCKISLASTSANTRAIYSGYTTPSILISATYVRVYSSLNMSNVNLIIIFALRSAKRTKKNILMFYASEYLLFLVVFIYIWLQEST